MLHATASLLYCQLNSSGVNRDIGQLIGTLTMQRCTRPVVMGHLDPLAAHTIVVDCYYNPFLCCHRALPIV